MKFRGDFFKIVGANFVLVDDILQNKQLMDESLLLLLGYHPGCNHLLLFFAYHCAFLFILTWQCLELLFHFADHHQIGSAFDVVPIAAKLQRRLR
jgi:hypothetical protein